MKTKCCEIREYRTIWSVVLSLVLKHLLFVDLHI